MAPDKLKDIFDETAQMIIALSEEVKSLAVKFGESSYIVSSRAGQLAQMVKFYDAVDEEINQYRKALHMAHLVLEMKDLTIIKHETNLSWEKSFALNNINDPEGARELDRIQDMTDNFYKQNKALLQLNGEAEE